MVREVRGQYIKDKFKDMSKRELAKYINGRRFEENISWDDIVSETGMSEKAMRRLLAQEGYKVKNLTVVSLKNFTRNRLVIETYKEYAKAREPISQQGIADIVTKAGFPVNRGTVNGIIDRAREQGLLPPSEAVITIGCKGPKKVNYGFNGPWTGPGKPEGNPPRTPELLAKGRVSYDDMKAGMCKYTPNEEAPFFFCGEAVTAGMSWCKDCHQGIIIRGSPHGGDKVKTPQGEADVIAA